jgi:hypothetical protein
MDPVRSRQLLAGKCGVEVAFDFNNGRVRIMPTLHEGLIVVDAIPATLTLDNFYDMCKHLAEKEPGFKRRIQKMLESIPR